MMVSSILLLLFCGLFSFVLVKLGRRNSAMKLVNEETAFEGGLNYYALTPQRVAELKPLVDRVGVISRGLGERSSGGNREVFETFDVFVIDIVGAFHDVASLEDRAEAARLAREVADRFGIPLDDPSGILLGN